MPRREEAVFPARLEALPRASAFARAFCEGNGVAADDAARLRLILEELFTNTVQHGHGGDCDAPVRIVLELRDKALSVLYEDSAPPYDPTRARAAVLGDDLESRPQGGLGLHLVRELSSELRYAYAESCNRLWLTVRGIEGDGRRSHPSG